MKQLLILASALVITASASAAEEKTAMVADSKATVHFRRQNKVVLLEAYETAKAFGWVAKLVTPGKLLTICREGKNGICVPIRLKKVKWKQDKKQFFVEAKSLQKALRFSIDEKQGKITLRPMKQQQADAGNADLPAYNAAWGKGRGFRVGQTLPDIPLYDLDGSEVRFSKFLGKQLAIYVWASW